MAHVKIPDVSSRLQFDVGQVATSVFNFNFSYFQASDVYVWAQLKDGTAPVELLNGTDYTLAGNAVDAGFEGGSVTLGTALTDAYVTIYRAVPYERLTDFPHGPFSIEALNSDLDRMVAMIQQVREEVSRAFRLNILSTGLLDALNFPADQRANKLYGFDEFGELALIPAAGTWRGPWVQSTLYTRNDLVSDPVDGSIYYCKLGHISGTGVLLDESANWSLFLDITNIGKIRSVSGLTEVAANPPGERITMFANSQARFEADADGVSMVGSALRELGETQQSTETGSTFDIALGTRTVYRLKLTGPLTVTVGGYTGMLTSALVIVEKNGHVIQWPSNIKWPDGIKPEQERQGLEMYGFVRTSEGEVLGVLSGRNFQ